MLGRTPLSKRAERRLSRYSRIICKALEFREAVFEVTTKPPNPVLDGLRSRWNKRRRSDFLFFLVPDRNGDRVTGKLSRSNELPYVFLETSR